MYIKLGESGAPCLMPLELLEVEVEVPFTKTEKEAIVTRPLISLSVFLQSSFYEAYREEIGKLLLKYLGLPLCIGLSKKKKQPLGLSYGANREEIKFVERKIFVCGRLCCPNQISFVKYFYLSIFFVASNVLKVSIYKLRKLSVIFFEMILLKKGSIIWFNGGGI